MGQQYPYFKRLEQNIVVIIHIYGDRAIFVLFCDQQDTESESYEIEISTSQPIFAHNKIPKDVWDKNIHTP